MGRRLSLVFCITAVLALIVSSIPNSYAAKTGSACKKLNAKNWDGEQPIVCKKVKNKLVWTKFGSTSAKEILDELEITLIELNETSARGNESLTPERACDIGGFNYRDISSTTGVEVRDGNSALLATGVLGNSTVVANSDGIYGNCVFVVKIKLKRSDFYQIKIGRRYDASYSRADLQRDNWKIALTIGR